MVLIPPVCTWHAACAYAEPSLQLLPVAYACNARTSSLAHASLSATLSHLITAVVRDPMSRLEIPRQQRADLLCSCPATHTKVWSSHRRGNRHQEVTFSLPLACSGSCCCCIFLLLFLLLTTILHLLPCRFALVACALRARLQLRQPCTARYYYLASNSAANKCYDL